MKIALAMIVKGDDKEAELLDRCLQSVGPYVDGIFITITRKPGEKLNQATEMVCIDHDAVISEFEWVNDFSAARNFNFSQVPKEFDYIMWTDADDIWRGLEKLKPTIEANLSVDSFAFWYMYDFDETRNPTVVHKKSMIVKNDGCVEWMGKLHEDFKENRSLNSFFVEGIERLHLTTTERVLDAQKRNVEVSLGDVVSNPDDPRVYWNLANSYLGANDSQNALDMFNKFVKMSNSEEEKYLAWMRIGMCHDALGAREDAYNALRLAIGLRPMYPDAYYQIANIYFNAGDDTQCANYALKGLTLKPPYHSMIVYNPRDYDYNPMMLLAKAYYNLSRPDLAVVLLRACAKIYPKDEYLKTLIEETDAEAARMNEVLKIVKELQDETDLDKIKITLDSIPADYASHPAVCVIRNKHFVKTESSGKDIVYYCGYTQFEWNPDLFQTKGFGGSEEAVYNLSKEWAKLGYNVTVYNNCGHKSMVRDGVTYKPFWEWNHRNKEDITVLWRSARPLDYDINSKKIFVDLHDVVPPGEFTEKRVAKVDKIFVKTNFHRSLFPNVPDNKFAIIPNGQANDYFEEGIERDPYLIINTSSPDRSMDVTPEIFGMIKKFVPQAKMKWCYGWTNFDNAYENDAQKMAWKETVLKAMEENGIENLGRITQKEVAKLYQQASVLLYPTEFAEIDCITVKKAQAAGCIPVTTDFGALDESVQHGIKVHSEKNKDNWSKPYQFTFGVETEKQKKEFARCVADILLDDMDPLLAADFSEGGIEWAKKFDWPIIAKQWESVVTC